MQSHLGPQTLLSGIGLFDPGATSAERDGSAYLKWDWNDWGANVPAVTGLVTQQVAKVPTAAAVAMPAVASVTPPPAVAPAEPKTNPQMIWMVWAAAGLLGYKALTGDAPKGRGRSRGRRRSYRRSYGRSRSRRRW
jgi:hypothetical protein